VRWIGFPDCPDTAIPADCVQDDALVIDPLTDIDISARFRVLQRNLQIEILRELRHRGKVTVPQFGCTCSHVCSCRLLSTGQWT